MAGYIARFKQSLLTLAGSQKHGLDLSQGYPRIPRALPPAPPAPLPPALSVSGSSSNSTAKLQVQQADNAAKAEESNMSTAAVTLQPTAPTPVKTENAIERFIDKIGAFFTKSQPIVEGIEDAAIAAEPFLALSPVGPEYDLVVNAIVGVEKTATASVTAGATLTGLQKMALVIQAVTPGLTAILASKKVTSGIPAAISQFAQNVYNLQTGPVTTVAPTAAEKAAA